MFEPSRYCLLESLVKENNFTIKVNCVKKRDNCPEFDKVVGSRHYEQLNNLNKNSKNKKFTFLQTNPDHNNLDIELIRKFTPS